MRRTLAAFSVLLTLSLVYCDDATGPELPVAFGVVSGDGQLVEAGRDSLLAPVVGQAYRDASGNVAFGLVSPLHAQTPIGTGVPNVLTCAEPVGENGLEPYITCRETDAQGFVSYWFEPGTEAGEACAEIRAEIDGVPQALATTCSTVEPGPVAAGQLTDGGGLTVAPGESVDLTPYLTDLRDAHGNAIDPADVQDQIGWAHYSHDRFGNTIPRPESPEHDTHIATVPADWCEGECDTFGESHYGVVAWVGDTYVGGVIWTIAHDPS